MLSTGEHWWWVHFVDGPPDRIYGSLTVENGALWITRRGPAGQVESQVAFPLVALVKWVRV